MVDEHQHAKQHREQMPTLEAQENANDQYLTLDCRQDKSTCIEKQDEEAQQAADRRGANTL